MLPGRGLCGGGVWGGHKGETLEWSKSGLVMSDFDNFRWDLFVTMSSMIREPLAGAISNQSHPKVGETQYC